MNETENDTMIYYLKNKNQIFKLQLLFSVLNEKKIIFFLINCWKFKCLILQNEFFITNFKGILIYFVSYSVSGLKNYRSYIRQIYHKSFIAASHYWISMSANIIFIHQTYDQKNTILLLIIHFIKLSQLYIFWIADTIIFNFMNILIMYITYIFFF